MQNGFNRIILHFLSIDLVHTDAWEGVIGRLIVANKWWPLLMTGHTIGKSSKATHYETDCQVVNRNINKKSIFQAE